MTRIGSLCTGFGGLDLAVHSVLGGELAWVADLDPGASKILAHRFPDVPNFGDITSADWSAAEPVDILTAGFPCQPVSAAGKRRGTDDERWLFDDICTAVGHMVTPPRLLVFENVYGLLSANGGDAMARVVHGLAALGYVGRFRLLRASDAGAPHRRERVFIIARLAQDADSAARGERRLAAPGEAEGGRARADAGRRDRAPAADTDLPRRQGPESAKRRLVPARGAPADTQGDRRNEGRPESARLVGGSHASERGHEPLADADSCPSCGCAWYFHDAGGFCAGPCGGYCPTPADTESDTGWLGNGDDESPTAHADSDGLARLEERDGEPATGLHGAPGNDPLGRVLDWGPYASAIARWERVLGRPAPRPTEPGRTGERLSPRFVEWLMGLPEGWVTDVPGLSRNAMLKALGNGVVPQQAALALRLLLDRAELQWLEAAA